LLCDFIVAGEAANSAFPRQAGLMPGDRTQTLSRIIGKPLAKELNWTGRRSSLRARQLRIVNHVAPQGKAMEKSATSARDR